MSRAGWMLALAVLVALAVFGCDQASSGRAVDSGQSPSSVDWRPRAVDLDTARREAPEWQPWLESLARLETTDRVGPGRLVGAEASRLLWDETLGQSVLALADETLGPIAVLTDLQRQLDLLEIDLLVLPVPPIAAVQPEATAEGVPSKASRVDRWLLEILVTLDQRGIEIFDLVRVLQPAPTKTFTDSNGRTGSVGLFRQQDPHWTHHGASQVAAAVVERIRHYPWFDTVVATRGQAERVDRQGWRDALGPIARRLQRDDPSLDLAPEPIFERFTRIRGEQWSFIDRESPILLLGDSFALREHGFPDALLRQLGFRVDQVTVAGGLPTAALEALALRGDDLEGKRLVIWLFTTTSWSEPQRWRKVQVVRLGDVAEEDVGGGDTLPAAPPRADP